MSCLYFRGLGLGLTDNFNPLHAKVCIEINVIKIESNPGAHYRTIGALGHPFGVIFLLDLHGLLGQLDNSLSLCIPFQNKLPKKVRVRWNSPLAALQVNLYFAGTSCGICFAYFVLTCTTYKSFQNTAWPLKRLCNGLNLFFGYCRIFSGPQPSAE